MASHSSVGMAVSAEIWDHIAFPFHLTLSGSDQVLAAKWLIDICHHGVPREREGRSDRGDRGGTAGLFH